jgi:PhnB protein
MAITTVTHLNFRGDARQALTFYQSVFGGNTVLVSYQDAYQVQNPAEADQIMWGQVTSEKGFQIMAYDVPSSMGWDQGENAFFVSVRGDDTDEIGAYWAKLSTDATIIQPLAPAQWSPLYGMLKDQFGVIWVLDVAIHG